MIDNLILKMGRVDVQQYHLLVQLLLPLIGKTTDAASLVPKAPWVKGMKIPARSIGQMLGTISKVGGTILEDRIARTNIWRVTPIITELEAALRNALPPAKLPFAEALQTSPPSAADDTKLRHLLAGLHAHLGRVEKKLDRLLAAWGIPAGPNAEENNGQG